MTNDVAAAMDEARSAAGRGPDELLERLIEAIGGRAGVDTVFGTPVERGEVTVIPVARIRWGVGGGSGGMEDGREVAPAASGSGGGGGVIADPVGYVELGPGGATFKPIGQPMPSPLFLLASGVTAAIVLRSLARVVRR
jgi:hypothetical protein